MIRRMFYLNGKTLAVVLVSATLAFGITTGLHFTTLDEKDDEICLAIEGLKDINRREAWADFNEANRALRILGIPPSAEIRDFTRDQRVRRLRANARVEC